MLSSARICARHVRFWGHSCQSHRAYGPRHYRDRKGRDVEPLRILYCGSDDFSVESLKVLTEAHRGNKDFIESIDVVCKTPKRYGRGLTKVSNSPVKVYAEGAGLQTHPIDTFTGWQPPTPGGKDINLIVAVSFGLFVPPRLLNLARYGGLNIHPSLLPALRGPAPLKHTLLQGLTHTGVTLCTLHPKLFDHGILLRQQRFDLSPEAANDHDSLVSFMATRGAALLERGLREGCFISPSEEEITSESDSSHAPKFKTSEFYIMWQHESCEQILRRQRALKELKSTVPNLPGHQVTVQPNKLRSVGRLSDPSSRPCAPGVPRIYWIMDSNFWIDRTGVIASADAQQPLMNPSGMVDVPANACDGMVRVGKRAQPAVGGFWSKDGHFMTFEAMTIRRHGGIHKTHLGSVESIRALCNMLGPTVADRGSDDTSKDSHSL